MPEYPPGFVKGTRGSTRGWCPECGHVGNELPKNAFFHASKPTCPCCQAILEP
jgi:hypothetical protein